MELDERFKHLVKELGQAINESLAESEHIADVMSRIRATGYDLFLVLEVTIGFNKRGETNLVHHQKLSPHHRAETAFHLTNEDAQFLRALHISIEDESR